jgi:hypothetical protein
MAPAWKPAPAPTGMTPSRFSHPAQVCDQLTHDLAALPIASYVIAVTEPSALSAVSFELGH